MRSAAVSTAAVTPSVIHAAPADPPPPANPVVSLLAGVLSLFGLNTPTAPANPLGALVRGVFREIETVFGLVPIAGTPTVGTPTWPPGW